MEKLSLKELKEQNAEKEPEAKPVELAVVETTEDVKEPEPASEPEKATDDGDEPKEEVKEDEQEAWMQTENTENSDDDKKGDFVPNRGIAAVKRKLKAKLTAKDDELDTLKAEIETLKKGVPQAPEAKAGLPPRPKREDFDFDEDAYDGAIDDWNDKKLDLKLTTHNQRSQQQALQVEAEDALKRSVDGHYDKAAKLVEEGKITEEAYLNADRNVRQALDRVFSGTGDSIADKLIHTLNTTGEGSEKVMYQLGVSPSKLAKLEELLRKDPNGLSASVYLGTLQASITKPVKRRSSAPAPAAVVEGEGAKGGPSGTLHKEYVKAGNDIQSRISLKRKAKASGVDTSQW